MKNTAIPNFVNSSTLTINSRTDLSCGPLVSLIQNAGGVFFQHSMTPEQARDMAAALVAHADALEA